MNDVRSKIVIMPNNEDLYSLRNKRLISRGPAGPIRLELDEIYTLLNQPNRPAVFEVVVLRVDKYPTPKKIYSEPVRLTLQNYDQPYEEITGVDLKRLKNANARVTQVSTKATLVTTEEVQPAKVEVPEVVEERRGTEPYNKPTLTEVSKEVYEEKLEEFTPTEEVIEEVETNEESTEEIVEENEVDGEEVIEEVDGADEEKDPTTPKATNTPKKKKRK